MSSTYRPICMSHEPGLVIDTNWQDLRLLEAALVDPANTPELAAHVGCDLLGGRYSYPLIEVYCPPRRDNVAHHTNGHWIDAHWLRLVHLTATTWPNSEKLAEVFRSLPACWKPERVARLAAEL